MHLILADLAARLLIDGRSTMTSLKDEEVDRLDAFELGFAHLQAYKEEYGDCDVRYRYQRPDGYPLGRFVVAVRARWNGGNLSADRVELLKSVGLDPDPLMTLFNKGVEHLKAFKKEFGHTNVPPGYETKDGHPLGKWVILQREGYSADTLRSEREKALAELGFEFVRDARRARFERGLAALLAFKEREGHFNVPADHSEGDVLLGHWLAHRRAAIKAGKAPSYQVEAFEKHGISNASRGSSAHSSM
jgi:Helicase associated domain